MAVQPVRLPDPLRLRPETRLEVPRCDRRIRPGAPGAVSVLVPVPPRDSATGPVGDPRLPRSDRDFRVLPDARDVGVTVRGRGDDADSAGRSAWHPDPRLVQQPHADRGKLVRANGVRRRQVRRRRTGPAEPLRPHRPRTKRDAPASVFDRQPDARPPGQDVRSPRGPRR